MTRLAVAVLISSDQEIAVIYPVALSRVVDGYERGSLRPLTAFIAGIGRVVMTVRTPCGDR